MMIQETAPCYHDISTGMTMIMPQESHQSSMTSSSSSSCDAPLHQDTTTNTRTTDNTDYSNCCRPPITSLSTPQDRINDDHSVVSNNIINTTVDDEMNDSRKKNHCIYTLLCRCCRCCNYNNNNNNAFTDEQLLILAFISFLTFAILQMIFAIYVAHSHAMIGDSSVMLLDAITYLFNGYSERRKQQYYTQYQIQIQHPSQQQKQEPQQKAATLDHHDDRDVAIVNDTALVVVVDGETDDSSDHAATTTSQKYYKSDNNEEPEPELLLLQLRQKVILLEVVAPSISVMALILVTMVVTQQAIHTIQTIESTSSTTRHIHHAEEPNLYIILLFSIFNLLLDGINMYFFTRPKNVSICSKLSFWLCSGCRRFRRPTAIIRHSMDDENDDGMTDPDMTDFNHHHHHHHSGDRSSIDNVIQQHPQTMTTNHNTHKLRNQSSSDVISTAPSLPSVHRSHSLVLQEETLHHNHSIKHHHHSHPNVATTAHTKTKTLPTNMNMCSAYTHVLADTLRSIAVITAVLLALYNDIEPALADATAALIVSFLIALSLIPLLQGLYHNLYELYNIRLQLQQKNQLELPTSSSIALEEMNHNNSTIV